MSERKLASIQTITEILPIDGADKIVCVKILGWQCVALKTEFSINDKCVFFEIDSVLPIAQWNDHLRKDPIKPLRIKTIRLRGVLSQGLALPISILPQGKYEVGQDVTSLISVEKYEPVVPAELTGKVKGTRPSWIPKTDESRLQSFPDVLSELVSSDIVIGTMKMDGSSITSYIKDGVFGVTSRNMELLETENNAYWKAARESNIEEKMRKYFENKNIAAQGELCGNSIQGNRMGEKKLVIYFYNLYDIDKCEYLSDETLSNFTSACDLKRVPVVFNGKLTDNTTANDLLEKANNLNYPNGTPAEGIVWRPSTEMHSNVLNGRLSIKTISNKYLEKYKE
jgi:RNA ligase (TIGR02306 family)